MLLLWPGEKEEGGCCGQIGLTLFAATNIFDLSIKRLVGVHNERDHHS